jgi:hypothetical protein
MTAHYSPFSHSAEYLGGPLRDSRFPSACERRSDRTAALWLRPARLRKAMIYPSGPFIALDVAGVFRD